MRKAPIKFLIGIPLSNVYPCKLQPLSVKIDRFKPIVKISSSFVLLQLFVNVLFLLLFTKITIQKGFFCG